MSYNIPEVLRKILVEAPHSQFTLVVDNKIDPYPTTEYPDGTWSKPFRSIQDAVDVANALPFSSLDAYSVEIRIQEGTYDEDIHVTRWGFFSLIADGPVVLGIPPLFGPPTPRSIYWDVNAPDPGAGFASLFIGRTPLYTGEPGVIQAIGSGFTVAGNVVLCGNSGIGSPEGQALVMNAVLVFGDETRTTASGRYGVVGNDGNPGLVPGAYPVLASPLAVALQNSSVGYDSGSVGMGVASVELLPDTSAVIGGVFHVYGDVNLPGGPTGCVLEATNGTIDGNLLVPNSLSYLNLIECGVGKALSVHNIKRYGVVRSTSIMGSLTITGTAAEIGDGYIFDSQIGAAVTAPNANSFRIDRTTDYYIAAHGVPVTAGATLVIETGGGSGATAFTGLSDVPHSYVGVGKYIVRVDSVGAGLEFVPPGSVGAHDFTDLADVPHSYVGQGGKLVRVDSVGAGLEFDVDRSDEILVISSSPYDMTGDEGVLVGDTTATVPFLQVNLPFAAAWPGRRYTIKRMHNTTSPYPVVIFAQGGESIDDKGVMALAGADAVQLVSDGFLWHTLLRPTLGQVTAGGSGGAVAPSAGIVGDDYVSGYWKIVGWTIISDAAGNVVFDVKTCGHGSFPGGLSSIVGGAPPTMAIGDGRIKESAVLAGWTLILNDGDVVETSIVSADTLTRAQLTLHLERD